VGASITAGVAFTCLILALRSFGRKISVRCKKYGIRIIWADLK
jgi:hypothetical protein